LRLIFTLQQIQNSSIFTEVSYNKYAHNYQVIQRQEDVQCMAHQRVYDPWTAKEFESVC